MNYTISQIDQIVNALSVQGHSESSIQSVYIDTRQITIPDNALFVAIETAKNDGHKFIGDAYNKGIRHFLVHSISDEWNYPDACFILVQNTLKALQQLAHYHRRQFSIPVIGITGSNGKTIVKEWLYDLLKDNYSICRSPKSFNSQIGVPLSVLHLQAHHNLAIFEAGISQPNEMEHLESIIQPTIAVLTYFGTAHSENFHSDEEKLKEKLKLFTNASIKIIQKYQHSFLQNYPFSPDFIGISEQSNDTIVVTKVDKQKFSTQINLLVNGQSYSFTIPFVDDASIKNAITCFACIYYLNPNEITNYLPKFSKLSMISLRMEIKKGKYQSVIISDYYNSDIDSFEIAMSYFHHYKSTQKVLIISDFEQIKNEQEIYHKALQIIHQYPLSKVFFIGKDWQHYHTQCSLSHQHFLTTTDFLEHINAYSTDFFNAVILIKGARVFEFEKIDQQLELKTHDTILEINIPALWHNLKYYKNKIGKHTQMMCMLKAAGYGSGSIEMAYALQKFGINYIAVAYTDEGVELRQANIQLPIMVMLPERHSFKDIIQYQLEPEIYSFEILNAFTEELQKQGIDQYPVHIKLDTGMHRLGFLPDEVPLLIETLKNNFSIKVKSVFSHLAASESDLHREYTLHQINLFNQLADEIEQQLNYKFIKHICNSAAIARYPEAHLDMVRIGIGMYGISDDVNEQRQLQNVLTLKTIISQIKHLKKGDSVGYNRNAVLEKDSTIAVIPIGYADGFWRKLGNQQFQVKYKDSLIPTIGNVCMDMTMIDISGVNAQVGDEIIIFNSAEDIKRMASIAGTIPYEILTSISQRVKRVYVYE